jgi:hypothetical protein
MNDIFDENLDTNKALYIELQDICFLLNDIILFCPGDIDDIKNGVVENYFISRLRDLLSRLESRKRELNFEFSKLSDFFEKN